jgi:formylmethanofuran dehydrogenase subunit E
MPDDAADPTSHPVPESCVLSAYMDESAARHQHLCPRQILGIRIGLAGLRALGFVNEAYQPRFRNQGKRLLTIVETDGCGADGVSVATDCVVGRRTLRVFDFGKVAATLVDTLSGRAVRVAPAPAARPLAIQYATPATNSWHSYLQAYQVMPDHELLHIQPVELTRSLAEILSRPGLRVVCQRCGEEIMNEREVLVDGTILCRGCAGEAYYRLQPSDRVD